MNAGLVRWRRVRWLLFILLAIVVVAGVAVWLIRLLDTPEPKKKKVMQEIALLRPPPPPPPPKVTPPKEEIKEKIDVPKPQDQPQPDAPPPPGPDLAVDAAGGAGDGFGLLGKKGGMDLLGAGGGSRFAWYGGQVKDRIQEAVARDDRLRELGEFQRVVHVWISASGEITRIDLVGPAPSAALDKALRVALKALPPMREGPPSDMPMPLRLRISAR